MAFLEDESLLVRVMEGSDTALVVVGFLPGHKDMLSLMSVCRWLKVFASSDPVWVDRLDHFGSAPFNRFPSGWMEVYRQVLSRPTGWMEVEQVTSSEVPPTREGHAACFCEGLGPLGSVVIFGGLDDRRGFPSSHHTAYNDTWAFMLEGESTNAPVGSPDEQLPPVPPADAGLSAAPEPPGPPLGLPSYEAGRSGSGSGDTGGCSEVRGRWMQVATRHVITCMLCHVFLSKTLFVFRLPRRGRLRLGGASVITAWSMACS